MSVHFMTSSPDALLREFNRRIVQEEAWGKAEGWMLKGDTSYQHSEDVSDIGAMLVPSVDAGTLTFELHADGGKGIPPDVVKLYYTRLVETFLRWMDVRFDEVRLN
ncbi:hypothetical protein LV564_00955 (plasmid) [Komagataeibacter nataicola]|uniref:Uncharacterized protein n=4 Tax=Alphaproteobacteria TaxID=28211 RepID=A0A0U5EYH4_9PROT|nr:MULTISPECIES: hypothetical protein [Alphaproteobacteria]EGG79112.1 hypothetical protein SXCC_00198 [Gluconacetobacter sp. SXCC-1]GAN88589.1 hypothetical protein Gain_0256_003 [Komagataeibacter intermedius TF2]MBF0866146.1 hypothetical protein [Gluconobacter sp. R71656]MBF0869212.1 hypothetical protein [Gluconobacter sp. R75628]MBF0875199.1 hypothetical protein [Gluconobacter sp. R75629]